MSRLSIPVSSAVASTKRDWLSQAKKARVMSTCPNHSIKEERFNLEHSSCTMTMLFDFLSTNASIILGTPVNDSVRTSSFVSGLIVVVDKMLEYLISLNASEGNPSERESGINLTATQGAWAVDRSSSLVG